MTLTKGFMGFIMDKGIIIFDEEFSDESLPDAMEMIYDRLGNNEELDEMFPQDENGFRNCTYKIQITAYED